MSAPALTNGDLCDMARDALLNFVDHMPDPAGLAWARVDEAYNADLIAIHDEVAATHGTGYDAALEYVQRQAVRMQQRDAEKLRGMTAVAGLLLGMLATARGQTPREALLSLPNLPDETSGPK